MASLKKEYNDNVKFYFVEYNQVDAQPVIEKFNIQAHPETYIIDKNDEVAFKMEGFNTSTGESQLKVEIERVLE